MGRTWGRQDPGEPHVGPCGHQIPPFATIDLARVMTIFSIFEQIKAILEGKL